MGEQLVWACKNGDMDQVKAIVEKPVSNRLEHSLFQLCVGVEFCED